MTGGVLLAVCTAAVVSSGWLIASSLVRDSVVSGILAIGLVAYGEIVLVAFLLSAIGALGRTGFVVALLAFLGLALVAWVRFGRPRGPVRAAVKALRQTLADPALAVLAGLVGLALTYMAVVAVATVQLDSDSTDYHLPRAVLWLQQGGIGRIAGAADPRLSWAPPGAETVVSLVLSVAGSDRFVALPQFAAMPMAMLAVTGIARRLGFDRRAAVFAGLVFGSLPIVLLQAPTALNDLVLVAMLLAAFHYSLGGARVDMLMCAIAAALAMVTKLTAVVALPLLLLLVLVVSPRSAARALVGVGAGAAIGGSWYMANLVRTGSLDGGWGRFFEQTPDRSPVAVTIQTQKYVLDLFDASGFVGDDRWWLPIAGGLLLVGGVVLMGLGRLDRHSAGVVVAAALLVATLPWLLDATRWALVRAFAHLLRFAGHRDRIGELPLDPSTNASPVSSWYGILFTVLWLMSVGVTARGVLRRTTSARYLALLVAPIGFAVLFSIATVDDGNRGRFFGFSVGAAVAGFAIVYPYRLARIVTPAVVGASMLVLAVHVEPRPIGFELLAPVRAPAVWGKDRFEAHDALASQFDEPPSWVDLDHAIGGRARLAIEAVTGVNLYPLFGADNQRRLELVGPSDEIPRSAEGLVVTPRAPSPDCADGWQRTHSAPNGYVLFERGSLDACHG